MNSLSDLNNFSSVGIPYTDNRTSELVFTPNVAVNQTITSSIPQKLPVGLNLTSIINGQNYYNSWIDESNGVSTNGLTYSVKLNIGGTLPNTSPEVLAIADNLRFTNANLYSNSSYSVNLGSTVGTGNLVLHWSLNNSGPGSYNWIKYDVEGIKSLGDWNLVKNPWIYIDGGLIESTISGNGVSRSWYTTQSYFYRMIGGTDTGYVTNGGLQQITPRHYIDVKSGLPISNQYTCEITYQNPNVMSSFTAGGTIGGTVTWDSSNCKLTLTGNLNQVNDKLNNLFFTPSTDYSAPFTLTYTTTNSNVGVTVSNVQNIVTTTNSSLTKAVDTTYTTPATNTIKNLGNSAPKLIVHTGGNITIGNTSVSFLSPTTTYRVDVGFYGTIPPGGGESGDYYAANILNVSATGTLGGNQGWQFYSPKVFSMWGNVAQLNSMLGNVNVTIKAGAAAPRYDMYWDVLYHSNASTISSTMNSMYHTT